MMLALAGSAMAASRRGRTLFATVNLAPTVSVGADRNVSLNSAVSITAVASDPDGSIASYAWTKVGGTASPTLTGASTANLSFTAPGSSDTLIYRCTVTDDKGATNYDDVIVNVSAVTPLAYLPYPVPADFTPNSSITYTDGNTVTYASTVRMSKGADPGGGSEQVYLRRILRSEWANGTSNVRNEKVWIDFNGTAGKPNLYMVPGNDYWGTTAFRLKSDETPTSNGGLSDNELLVYQIHSEGTGGSQPDLAIYIDIGRNQMYVQRAWNATPDADDTGANTSKDYIGAYPTLDTWYKFIWHLKPGYTSGQGPKTEVWMQVGSSTTWTKVVDKQASTDLNTHAVQGSELGSYPRDGFYKWSGTGWAAANPTIAMWQPTPSFALVTDGSSRFNECAARLAPLNT